MLEILIVLLISTLSLYGLIVGIKDLIKKS